MMGTLINAASIALAGLLGRLGLREGSAKGQRRLQALLGGLTLGLGFHVIWLGLGGTAGQVLRQMAVVALGLVLGRATGRALGIQTAWNRLGQFARARLAGDPKGGRWPRGEIFSAATVIFCLSPLAVVGPLQEGLRGDLRALLVKSAVDALAALAWVRTRGWEVVAVAVPVLAFQGAVARLTLAVRERLEALEVAGVLYVTSGFLLLAVALVMLQILRIRLADYLPSLLWVGLLGWGLL